MTKTVHTVALPDGTTARRVSENRTYPFAVIGQKSVSSALRAARATTGDVSQFGIYIRD